MAKSSGGNRTMSTRVTISQAQSEVLRIAKIIEANGGHSSKDSQMPPLNIGTLPSAITKFAKDNNITLESTEMYMTTKGIEHSIRESKVKKGIAVTKEEIADFIGNKGKMSVFYDPSKRDFVFATEKAKFVLTPNYELKVNKVKTKVVNYITATRIGGDWASNFTGYIKIK